MWDWGVKEDERAKGVEANSFAGVHHGEFPGHRKNGSLGRGVCTINLQNQLPHFLHRSEP